MDINNTTKNVTVALNAEDREIFSKLKEINVRTIDIFRRGLSETAKERLREN